MDVEETLSEEELEHIRLIEASAESTIFVEPIYLEAFPDLLSGKDDDLTIEEKDNVECDDEVED